MNARSTWWRFVRGALIVLGIVTLFGGLALGWYLVRNGRRREAELESIRARGEPVRPDDLVWPARGEGDDPSPWMASMAALPDEEWSLSTLPECSGELAAADEEALSTQYESSFWDLASLDPPSPCFAAILRREVECEAALLELALEVERFSGIDWAERFTSDGTVKTFRPRLQNQLSSVVQVLCRSALECTLQGRAEDAVRRLDLAWRATALFDHCPCRFGTLIWASLSADVFRATARLSRLLPDPIDLTLFEDRLATLDARPRLLSGLLGERALGNRIFDCLRRRSSAIGEFVAPFEKMGRFRELTIWLTLDHDQCVYLEHMAKAIDAVEQYDPLRIDRSWEPENGEQITSVLAPDVRFDLQVVAGFEALRDLVRGALLARREGAQAAIAWVTAQPDPMGSSHLHATLEDEVLSLWSVGDNAVDDGGSTAPTTEVPEAPLDLVVRVRAR